MDPQTPPEQSAPADSGQQARLALAHQSAGRFAEALALYRAILIGAPAYFDALHMLGVLAQQTRNPAAAVYWLEKAVALQPSYADAANNLGVALKAQGQLEAASAAYRRALAMRPEHADAHNNLANILKDHGRLAEAESHYRWAVDSRPDSPEFFSNLLFCLQYSPQCSAQNLVNAQRQFAQRFEAAQRPAWRPHANAPDSRRRLKIGYVSGDFRRHPVAYFIEPVLAQHDATRVEVYAYHNHPTRDAYTERIAAAVAHWLPCAHWPDAQLAERIRADGIDVLVDLAGHTAYNRMTLFARKPAPVQVTSLGYPGSSGLTAIDYRLTDRHAEPPGLTESQHSEQLWRLPDAFFCYRPIADSPACSARPPLLDKAYVTFACLNNFAKLSDEVLALWARLLQRVPASRLLLSVNGLDAGRTRAAIEARLSRLGIAPQRVDLLARVDGAHLSLYQGIDIALDPFPFNGHTTSLETLWMGVPLVTLAGQRFVARMGVSVLATTGLHELIAQTPEEYIGIAAALARDPARLAALSAGLRQRLKQSPLLDARGFTAQLEQAYREMFERWCQAARGREQRGV